jgi:hypothetical protein
MTREGSGASSFDELAIGLSSGKLSRGKALKLMGAALVGSTLASFGIGGVASADLCKPNGKVCKKDSQCCSRFCNKVGTNEVGTCATPECLVDEDCDDSNACTSDKCVNRVCVHEDVCP